MILLCSENGMDSFSGVHGFLYTWRHPHPCLAWFGCQPSSGSCLIMNLPRCSICTTPQRRIVATSKGNMVFQASRSCALYCHGCCVPLDSSHCCCMASSHLRFPRVRCPRLGWATDLVLLHSDLDGSRLDLGGCEELGAPGPRSDSQSTPAALIQGSSHRPPGLPVDACSGNRVCPPKRTNAP